MLLPDLSPAAEIEGILRRSRKYSKSWESHLKKCLEFQSGYLQSKSFPGSATTVSILGSGLLLETPASIYEKFSRIICVDRIHHQSVFALKQQFPQIEFRNFDLNYQDPDWESDLWISANLLSQLPRNRLDLLLSGRARDYLKHRRDCQLRHWEFLKAQKSFLLWSDFSVRSVDRKNRVCDEESTLDSDLKVLFQEAWEWNLIPRGILRRGIVMEIGGAYQ
jgi:hypothetical protein